MNPDPGIWQRMVTWWRGHLRVKLLTWFGLAVMVPVLVVASLLMAISERALRSAIERQQMEVARSLVDRVEEQLRGCRTLLGAVAKHPDLKRWSLSHTQGWLRELIGRHPAFQAVALVNAQGREVMRADRTPGRVRIRHLGADHSTQEVFMRSFHRQLSYEGPPVFGKEGIPHMLMAEPLAGRQGVLFASVSLAMLSSFVAQSQVGAQGQAFILNSDGTLIAHPMPERVRARANFAELPVVREFLAKGQQSPGGLREHRDEGGEPVVAFAMAAPSLDGMVVVQQPKRIVFEPLRRMRARFVGWTVLWLSVFGLGGWFVVNRILRPVRELQRGVESVRHGQWEVHLRVRTGDELETLARTFQQMADALRELEELRRDLIAMIVHDLKSPLTVILASLDWLLTEEETDEGGSVTEPQRRLLTLARQSGKDLLEIIQNLLDVARMEEGRLELHREPCRLADLVQAQVERWEPVAQLEQKTIQTELSNEIPPLDVDRTLIMRVLSNLVANAIRHTTVGQGVITLGLMTTESVVRVQVKDNGEGIPSEYQDRIFEKFVQAARKRARVRTGVGLGLTFCKMAVEAHGGRISVESQPGHGSTFTVTLPYERTPTSLPVAALT